MKAVSRIKKFLNPSGSENFKVVANEFAQFKLNLENLTVGFLKFENGNWFFEYSQDFKDSSRIKPLANFPDINKVYKSDTLWPFFVARIPSLSRNRVKQAVEKEGIKETDIISLLSQFGCKTITNPFELISMD